MPIGGVSSESGQSSSIAGSLIWRSWTATETADGGGADSAGSAGGSANAVINAWSAALRSWRRSVKPPIRAMTRG
jgi:hypothetical protein